MSYNGSGLFEINTAGQPVVAATTIDPTVFNALTADLATGLSTAIAKDGQTTVTADLPMAGYKHSGVGAGTARTHYASLANVQDGTGVYVATVGGTADAITLTPSPSITSYAAGQTFWFLAASSNTGAATVAVSGLAAKAIKKNGTTALAANDILSGSQVEIKYDGTNFQITSLGQSLISAVSTAQSDISTLQTNSISKATVDAKGDLLVGTADNTVARKAVGTNGYVLIADSSQSDGLSWSAPASAVSFMHSILNATFTVTKAANAMTIALKTAAGTDPSATDPVSVTFRHGTATNGTYVTRTITGALSTTISSGSTGGTFSNTAHRIYFGFLDNAGTVELCWWNPVSVGTLFSFQESELISTTAEGGAGAADSAAVIYSTTARSNVYARYAGYFESTQATAGTWASDPTKVQLMGPGVRRTGDLVQSYRTQTGAVATGSTTIPNDDTIPQNTEGDQYMTQAITPTSSVNLLRISALANGFGSSATAEIMALFQDSTASALAASWQEAPTTTGMLSFSLHYQMSSGTTSSTTFKIRIGGGGGTFTFNGNSGARRLGGVLLSYLDVTEICV